MTRPREHLKKIFGSEDWHSGIFLIVFIGIYVVRKSTFSLLFYYKGYIYQFLSRHMTYGTLFFGAQYDRKMLKMVGGTMQLCDWADMIS